MALNSNPESISPSSNQDIDGILWGWRWGNGSPLNLTFSFPSNSTEYAGYQSITTFEPFNEAQKEAVRQSLANISSFCQLTFTETTNAGATLRYATASSVNYTDDGSVAGHTGDHTLGTAEANPPELGYDGSPPFSPFHSQGDSWYNRTGYDNPQLGSYQDAAGIMHETGHNLGLKHGHVTQDGHGITFPALPSDHDSQEYSLMTYRQFPGNPIQPFNNPDFPTTYMQDDIAALQYMYGANYGASAQNGDTSYSWSTTTGQWMINGIGQGTPWRNVVFMTLWDGGGNDTYDLTNYTTNLSVNLNPGAWTILDTSSDHRQRADLGNNGSGGPEYFARGNIANALADPNNPSETTSFIENAKGGAGNDSFYGNSVDNWLTGGAGNDTMDGGAGNDTAVYSGLRSEYATSESSGNVIIEDQSSGFHEGRDQASNIEFFKFQNRTYTREEVLNQAPVLGAISVTSVIDENGMVDLSGSFTDESTDLHTITIDWGDPNDSTDTLIPLAAGVNSFNVTHTYRDDGPAGTSSPGANGTASDWSSLKVSVSDQLDNLASRDLANAVEVRNLNPTIDSFSNNLPSTGVIVQGDQVRLEAKYTDEGRLDYHTIACDWGDGSPVSSADETPLGGSTGIAAMNHPYNSYGTFTATMSIKDDDTGSATASQVIQVARKVTLDWKPGSNPSAISLRSGKIPVAILGSNGGTPGDPNDDFNVRSINVASLRFDDEKDMLINGGGINGIRDLRSQAFQVSFKDVNGDRIEDMVAQVDASMLGMVVNPKQDPFLSDHQIYAFGMYGDNHYFFGSQQLGDPLKLV